MPEVKLALWNNWDLVPADERTFETVEEAQEARKEYMKRFEHQGFYRDSSGNHVDLDQLVKHILIRPADWGWVSIPKGEVHKNVETIVIEGITFMNVCEEETTKYCDTIELLHKKMYSLKRDVDGKARLIRGLLCIIDANPDKGTYSFEVSINLLESEFKNDVINIVTRQLDSIAAGRLKSIGNVSLDRITVKKKGRWKRAWKAFKN